jgi:putative FmdB family regulatory protein
LWLKEERNMPVYTYRCDNCGVQFDRTQKFTDSPLVICPECGKKALHKVYQPVGIVFKGSGFYATDNRSPSGQTRSSASHAESKPAAETVSESKESATKSTEAGAKA